MSDECNKAERVTTKGLMTMNHNKRPQTNLIMALFSSLFAGEEAKVADLLLTKDVDPESCECIVCEVCRQMGPKFTLDSSKLSNVPVLMKSLFEAAFNILGATSAGIEGLRPDLPVVSDPEHNFVGSGMTHEQMIESTHRHHKQIKQWLIGFMVRAFKHATIHNEINLMRMQEEFCRLTAEQVAAMVADRRKNAFEFHGRQPAPLDHAKDAVCYAGGCYSPGCNGAETKEASLASQVKLCKVVDGRTSESLAFQFEHEGKVHQHEFVFKPDSNGKN